jgi:hypothetical protein
LVVNWVSSCLSFCMSASTAATYIFTDRNFRTTIIILEPRALNVEFEYFRLSCSILYWDLIKCLHFADTTERGDRGWKGDSKRGWRQGYFRDNSIVSKKEPWEDSEEGCSERERPVWGKSRAWDPNPESHLLQWPQPV